MKKGAPGSGPVREQQPESCPICDGFIRSVFDAARDSNEATVLKNWKGARVPGREGSRYERALAFLTFVTNMAFLNGAVWMLERPDMARAVRKHATGPHIARMGKRLPVEIVELAEAMGYSRPHIPATAKPGKIRNGKKRTRSATT